MSIEENKQIVRDFFEAMSNEDAVSAFGLLAEDVTWTIIGDTPVSRTFLGHDDFEENLLNEVFRHVKVEAGIDLQVVELIGEGNRVVARVKGTIEGEYGPYNNTYCHVFTIRYGKIASNVEHLDTALIYSALYGRTIS